MVDPELFERYQRALGTNADLCKESVEALISKLEGLAPLEQAEYLLANYPKLVRAYGKVAADVARQFYQEQRDQHVEGDDDASEYTAQTAAPIQESWAYEDVQKVASDGLGYLPKVAVRRVMQRADQTIAHNVDHDPARPRWAIVPHMGACGWCVMVASNGWAYSERSVNAQRHDGCKCSVAVDFDRDSPSLAGYDPDELRRQYAQGIDDAGGEDGIRAKWDALSSEEQAKYRRKGRSAYDVFKTQQIVNAMDVRTESEKRTRGRLENAVKLGGNLFFGTSADIKEQANLINDDLSSAWRSTPNISKDAKAYQSAYGSLICSLATNAPITVEDFTKVHGKEAQIARWLSKAGIPVHLRNPDAHAKSDGNTSDSIMRGITYDFKRLKSDKVVQMTKEVTGKLDSQGPGFVIDLSVCDMSFTDVMKRCAKLLDDKQISEFIVIHGGSATLIKK